MKKMFPFLLLAALAVSGCATHYDITLTSGETITAFGKPKHDEKRHIYLYKDSQGVLNGVYDFKVTLIEPSSFHKKGATQFIGH